MIHMQKSTIVQYFAERLHKAWNRKTENKNTSWWLPSKGRFKQITEIHLTIIHFSTKQKDRTEKRTIPLKLGKNRVGASHNHEWKLKSAKHCHKTLSQCSFAYTGDIHTHGTKKTHNQKLLLVFCRKGNHFHHKEKQRPPFLPKSGLTDYNQYIVKENCQFFLKKMYIVEKKQLVKSAQTCQSVHYWNFNVIIASRVTISKYLFIHTIKFLSLLRWAFLLMWWYIFFV